MSPRKTDWDELLAPYLKEGEDKCVTLLKLLHVHGTEKLAHLLGVHPMTLTQYRKSLDIRLKGDSEHFLNRTINYRDMVAAVLEETGGDIVEARRMIRLFTDIK